MGISKIYSYLFYKFYRFWEVGSVPKFWSDWKAELTIDVLEILLFFSAMCYYTVISKNRIDFDSNYTVLIYILGIALPNYFLFHHKNQWKEIINEFDAWPEEKNRKGSIVVLFVVFAVILNFILSFYLMSQND